MAIDNVFMQSNGQCVSTSSETIPLIQPQYFVHGNTPLWRAVCSTDSSQIGSEDIESARRDNVDALIELRSPIDNERLGYCGVASSDEIATAINRAREDSIRWRDVPAPKRGELVRRFGEKVRKFKKELAKLITLEAGKTWQESLGEVQEVIDVCDFAVGLSRQLHGLTITSERPKHRMMEQWHPLGVVGIITAFNFPMAVWAWNASLGLVCGNTLIWKPSEKTPLCALACQTLLVEAQVELGMNEIYPGLSAVVNGYSDAGKAIVDSRAISLVSATGSVVMGRSVAVAVAGRLGKTLLELGGNNALIVTSNADLNLALKAAVFSAVGTSGQRCTSLRRLFLHESIADQFTSMLRGVYETICVGDPRDDKNLCGPVISEESLAAMNDVVAAACSRGGEKIVGGDRLSQGVPEGGHYITPSVVEVSSDEILLNQETFAPILYIVRYSTLEEVVQWHNDVPQGLSSAIFTRDLVEAERFMSASGSDCGIANVNIGTSGAEIGGAFGGEKDTGGGRESGSDAWKQYMRRVTNTINYGEDIPLAQGIRFDM